MGASWANRWSGSDSKEHLGTPQRSVIMSQVLCLPIALVFLYSMKAWMMRVAKLVLVSIFALWLVSAPAQGQSLPRSSPESQGVSSQELAEFIAAADQVDALHSFMLVRHGQVIAEAWWAPYDANSNHVLYSLSKSFASTAVGIAVAEGKLSIDDEVSSFFPDAMPSDASKNLKAMRVRDLLTMATGHQEEPPTRADLMNPKSFLAQPVPHLPGTHFKYNTAATFMLSAIVQKQTQQTLLDYLRPRLFEPLGITQPVWDTNSEGVSLGGYGLRVRTEDIARFGQLYLNRGIWKGRQLLSENWVQQATSKQVSNGSDPNSDWHQGYGFQFWRCRHGAYRGDGAFGQYCIVMPEQDVVIAITSGVSDMQSVLNIVWSKLLPAFRPTALPSSPVAAASLQATLSKLSVRYAEGSETSPMSAQVFGKRFVFPDNDQKLRSVRFTHDTSGNLKMEMEYTEDKGTIAAAYHRWQQDQRGLGSAKGEPIAASFAWPAEDTLLVKVCAYETPFHQQLRCTFRDGQLTFAASSNVAFGPRDLPVLQGKAD